MTNDQARMMKERRSPSEVRGAPSSSFVVVHGAIVSVLAMLVGCHAPSASEDEADVTAKAASPSAASPVFPLRVSDGLGREVSLSRSPRRIVSLAPRNTEMLFALGAGDRVVGRTSFCNYPPEVAAITKVGGFSAKSLSLERIVGLQPDLVVSSGDLHAPMIQELERLGLPVLALTADSFRELFKELELLGRVTEHADEAAALIEGLQQRIDRVTAIAQGVPSDERVTVYYQVSDEPLTTAGPASYLGEMIGLCGGRNMIDDRASRFPKISLEVLLARDPEVIVAPTIEARFFAENSLRNRPIWNRLRAVRNRRIHLLDTDLISRCGPRLVDALELMGQALYPTHFAALHAKDARKTTGDGNRARP